MIYLQYYLLYTESCSSTKYSINKQCIIQTVIPNSCSQNLPLSLKFLVNQCSKLWGNLPHKVTVGPLNYAKLLPTVAKICQKYIIWYSFWVYFDVSDYWRNFCLDNNTRSNIVLSNVDQGLKSLLATGLLSYYISEFLLQFIGFVDLCSVIILWIAMST